MDDELRKAAGTAVDVWDDTDTRHEDVVNAMNDLRKVLAKYANAAPQPTIIGYVCRTGHGNGFKETISPELAAIELMGKKMWVPVCEANAAPQDQAKDAEAEWRDPASCINCGTHNKNAARYRWLRDHASDDWLDSGITDDAVDAAINDKSQWRSRNDSSN